MNESGQLTKTEKVRRIIFPITLIAMANSFIGRAMEKYFYISSLVVSALCFALLVIGFIVYGVVVWRESAEQKAALDKKYVEADAYLFEPKGNTESVN